MTWYHIQVPRYDGKNLKKGHFLDDMTQNELIYGLFWHPGAHKNPYKIQKRAQKGMKIANIILLHVKYIDKSK